MPSPRVRKPFAASFIVIFLAAAYLGLSTDKLPKYGQSDKGLHFITFFLLTTTAYWSVELPRRRLVHLTLLICTGCLAIGSEVAQALLPNGRMFDPFDILANVVGSALSLALSSWYHKRMLERKRKNKHYDIVPGEELAEDEERDVELGEGVGAAHGQESGVVGGAKGVEDASAGAGRGTTVTEELDNWDENASDWDDEPDVRDDGQKTPSSTEDGEETGRKRAD